MLDNLNALFIFSIWLPIRVVIGLWIEIKTTLLGLTSIACTGNPCFVGFNGCAVRISQQRVGKSAISQRVGDGFFHFCLSGRSYPVFGELGMQPHLVRLPQIWTQNELLDAHWGEVTMRSKKRSEGCTEPTLLNRHVNKKRMPTCTYSALLVHATKSKMKML